jgi:putative oxidoreductase
MPMTIRSTESPSAPVPGSSVLDGIAVGSYDHLLAVARIALGAIFVLSGYLKLTGLAAFSASLTARGVPAAWFWGPVGATVEFVGGILCGLGLASRYAALVMILFVIVATIISHLFWTFPDPAQFRMQRSQFFKNLSIIGGFVFLFTVGGGRFSLDALWGRNRS